MSRRKALEDFLRTAFSIQELERWIEHLDSEVRDEVDWKDGKAQVVFDVVERLAGRGRLDARFFRALAFITQGASTEASSAGAITPRSGWN